MYLVGEQLFRVSQGSVGRTERRTGIDMDEEPNQTAGNIGDDATVIQIQGDGNSVTINGQPFLALDTIERRRRRVARATPGDDLLLLRPDSRTTKLIGRDEDIRDFTAWLNSDAAISVRVIIGRAGAGKTRFALELMDRLAGDGAAEPW